MVKTLFTRRLNRSEKMQLSEFIQKLLKAAIVYGFVSAILEKEFQGKNRMSLQPIWQMILMREIQLAV